MYPSFSVIKCKNRPKGSLLTDFDYMLSIETDKFT